MKHIKKAETGFIRPALTTWSALSGMHRKKIKNPPLMTVNELSLGNPAQLNSSKLASFLFVLTSNICCLFVPAMIACINMYNLRILTLRE